MHHMLSTMHVALLVMASGSGAARTLLGYS